MHPALRYVASLCVALILTLSIAASTTANRFLVASLLPLYWTVASLTLAHRHALFSLSRDAAPARKRGALVGGVGALTGGFLLQTSIPAGAAGLGLLLLGTVSTAADVDDR
ncbi:hypothetical protein EFA46_012095 (plasmid) [Halarchaeum sp. CBA1220]|uniref:hypothetical protein n=1 Tax=Halarchaeum sp. CBA1220 TaxID=1853682 RepID=UPI000F3A9F8A|nr:hypothetical protein [Halarchaeum sp. CBA1220]QLC34992.1 hypothetical protein EFA46_012095 [Halarchaeum sp. CBA1220]